jgi:pimeloyl-ACP methyl ester carboxylesterase
MRLASYKNLLSVILAAGCFFRLHAAMRLFIVMGAFLLEVERVALKFLLIHGGWHDGSCWDDTAACLEVAGHAVFAPTLAGHGAEGGKAVTIGDCVDSVITYINEHDLDDFVLVGHSISGVVIAKVAEQVPERVQRLIFQNAYVLEDGQSVYDLLPAPLQQMLDRLRKDSPAAQVTIDFDIFQQMFINDADIDTAKAAFEKLCPGTINRQLEKMDMKVFAGLDIPTSYVHCTDDLTMAAADWSWHPDMTGRLNNPRVIEIPGSHEVCFSNPKVLAAALIEAALP